MTTTELIKLLQSVERGASGTSREITIYKRDRKGELELIISRNEKLEILSTGDGCAGAELSLIINRKEKMNTFKQKHFLNDDLSKQSEIVRQRLQYHFAKVGGIISK